MVDVIGRAKVIVTGDVDSRSIDQAGGKIGDSLKRGALIGGAALGTLAVAGVKAFQSFEQAGAQTRKLNQVLDNMGKSDAAPAITELADELSRLTAVDDEVIQQGQTILATFSQVADSAGEVGGVFERATRASVDLAATGFGTVESASVMLGKALQDPEKGITALRRAGVTFTEDQKKLIESLVETGEMGKAQAVILAEVEKQVGGTAEATRTESDSIRTAFGELQESAGHLIAELGGEDGEGGGLSGAIYGVADALNETAESEAWGTFGKDLRDSGSDVKKFAGELFALDKRIIGATLNIPGFGDALLGIAAPTLRITGLIADLADAAQDAWTWFKRLDGVSGDDVPDAPDISQPRETRAGGGPVSAFALVGTGENGPELVQFGGSGGYVYNNSQTRDILAAADSGGDTINYWQFYGPESLSAARRDAEWANTYGTRFGSAAGAGAR